LLVCVQKRYQGSVAIVGVGEVVDRVLIVGVAFFRLACTDQDATNEQVHLGFRVVAVGLNVDFFVNIDSGLALTKVRVPSCHFLGEAQVRAGRGCKVCGFVGFESGFDLTIFAQQISDLFLNVGVDHTSSGLGIGLVFSQGVVFAVLFQGDFTKNKVSSRGREGGWILADEFPQDPVGLVIIFLLVKNHSLPEEGCGVVVLVIFRKCTGVEFVRLAVIPKCQCQVSFAQCDFLRWRDFYFFWSWCEAGFDGWNCSGWQRSVGWLRGRFQRTATAGSQ